MNINSLFERFINFAHKPAFIFHDKEYSYAWLLNRIEETRQFLTNNKISRGACIALESDFSPTAVATFLALIEHEAMIVPIGPTSSAQRKDYLEISKASFSIKLVDESPILDVHTVNYEHDYYTHLRALAHAGLVIFSSGSTGKSKAAVHDISPLLKKFETPRRVFRSIPFLLFEHIGGFSTMMYSLSNGGCLVIVSERNPRAIVDAIEQHKVELLPTSPTFLNLMLISEVFDGRDLSSLKIVSYGTEPMPESTLLRFRSLFPDVELLQMYGLSEIGIMRSKSKDSGSLWIKIGGEGFNYRIVDGLLEIKADSAMLGYLNAPSPFTDDGWFKTGDEVEVDGEYIRILGRKSEMINVGGRKVYPAEVEGVILEIPEVAEAIAFGEKNPLMGNVVCAKVRLKDELAIENVIATIKKHCRDRLPSFKIPVKIEIVQEAQYNDRFKKRRIQ